MYTVRNRYYWLICFFVIANLFVSVGSGSSAAKASVHKNNGFAVVELFTSEGCSSCPPADKLIEKLLAEDKQDVYIVCFHVDYWNRLGWKDAFSQAAFSNRQRQYADHFSADGVYTPQIIVNGTDRFVGSDEAKLRASLLKAQEASNLTIKAVRTSPAMIHLSYAVSSAVPTLLNVAMVQPEATTSVMNGENKGKVLHHVNIVRMLKTTDVSTGGNLDIAIPEILFKLPFRLVVYAQQKSNLQITGAAQQQISL